MRVIENDTHSRRDLLVCVACICVVVIGVFHRVGGFDFVTWDDDRMLYANPHVMGLTADNLRWMFTDSSYNRLYMPLGWLFYAMTVSIFGLAAGWHHGVNLALHAVNAVLVFGVVLEILKRMFGEEVTPRVLRIISCASALLWATHPMRVEVVAWVGARVHGMAAVFALAAVWFYLWGRSREGTCGLRRVGYWISVACYALSILTFPSALMLPVVLFILDIYVLGKGEDKGREWWRRVIVGKVPFVVVAGISTGVSLWGRMHAPLMNPSPSLAEFGIIARMMQAFYVWGSYVYAQFVPFHLSPVYTRLYEWTPTQAIFIVSAAVVILISVIGFLFRRKYPTLWAAWLCHVVILVPFLGLTERPFYTSDRYSYLEGVVWCVLGAGVVVQLWRWRAMERIRGIMPVVGGVGLLAYSALSFAQTEIWRNTETLFNDVLIELGNDPYRAETEWRLGTFYLNRGDPEDALLQFDKSLQVKPDDMKALYSKGLAILQIAGGTMPGADRDALYLRAAECFDHVESEFHTALSMKWAGYAFAMVGKLGLAEDRLGRAVAKDIADGQTRVFLANIYHQDNKDELAIKQLDEAVRIDPSLAATRDQMVKAWAATTSAPAILGH